MDYDYLAYKEDWEQARFIAYLIAQTNSKKKLKLTDIVKFHWEKEEGKSKSSPSGISKEDIERLRQKAQKYINENLI